ncbi:TetR/AcrR family transcriptional regulator [Exiguobacterium sp. MMG028]|uniref:TetR/AcrR family transcriptional regulator n=1 Tax=Exiguobacterium sp. MMG028 TaxID=3021979 RepID=UPI0022FE3111|nr:TetR/AcrR family transcriptional regulator [Exiguobacterium sp. MMG028]MDA5560645.1 TetR/AcrR family transcriptional regulator [Exiguobacterium sp. MMG028]
MMMNEGKLKILQAAREIIVEQGIKGTTLRGIAERAGFSTGAIYHYYTSKEAILYDVMDEGLGEVKRIETVSHDDRKEAAVIIQEIYEGMQERLQKDAESRLQFYLAHEAMIGNEDIQQKFKEKYEDWIIRIEAIFVRAYGVEQGPMTRAVATWTMAGIDGMVLQTLLRTGTIELEYTNRVLHYLLTEGFPHFFQLIRSKETNHE